MYKYCYSNEGAIYAKGLLTDVPSSTVGPLWESLFSASFNK